MSALVSIVLMLAAAQSAGAKPFPAAVNPRASREARALLSFLHSIEGKYTLSGQHNFIATGSRLYRQGPRDHRPHAARLGLGLQLRLPGRRAEGLPALRAAEPDRTGHAGRLHEPDAAGGAHANGRERDRRSPQGARDHADVAPLPAAGERRRLRRQGDLDVGPPADTGGVGRADEGRHSPQCRVEEAGRRRRLVSEAAARRARARAVAAVPRDERRSGSGGATRRGRTASRSCGAWSTSTS